jgi:hypothetical protein
VSIDNPGYLVVGNVANLKRLLDEIKNITTNPIKSFSIMTLVNFVVS